MTKEKVHQREIRELNLELTKSEKKIHKLIDELNSKNLLVKELRKRIKGMEQEVLLLKAKEKNNDTK